MTLPGLWTSCFGCGVRQAAEPNSKVGLFGNAFMVGSLRPSGFGDMYFQVGCGQHALGSGGIGCIVYDGHRVSVCVCVPKGLLPNGYG